MSDIDEAISRITAWIRDYGDQKNPTFVADLLVVLSAAKDSKRLQSIVSTICDGATCNGFEAGGQFNVAVNATHWTLPNCKGVGGDSLIEAAQKARET